MAIRQLSLNDFRNLKSITLDFDDHYNVIVGNNGSGKTSLLEAISVICQGKSFKTHHLNHCIQHRRKNFLLFAKFRQYQVGLSRTYSNTTIRIDGENISRASELVEKTPVVSIDSMCLDLLTGPPGNRRTYIDWCLFHVEHRYRDVWNQYTHGLKQKNALLKKRVDVKELDYWDSHLSALCLEIYDLRKSYVSTISEIITSLNQDLENTINLSIRYTPGWPEETTPIESFQKNRSKDLRYGFTSTGSHRDNIQVLVNDLTINEVLSRGQIKKLAVTFYLAQILLVRKLTQKSIIVLIDDLESELDDDTASMFINLLSSLEVQIFITNIRNHLYLTQGTEEYKMFHVEHGMIKPVKNT